MWTGRLIWECKIGIDEIGDLAEGADAPMRQAIKKAYQEITGKEAKFTFSGWNAELTESERKALE